MTGEALALVTSLFESSEARLLRMIMPTRWLFRRDVARFFKADG